MIDTDNLRTASLYINNQLLSRGLLKDGQNIDFANPGRDDGDITATMGRIMSVVNDLILRRDRDAEHRESLSTTMRSLRADNLKLTNDVTRLTEKHSEAQRKLDIAESSEAAMKTQLKSAEAAVRGLKDEVARTKTLVSQARSSCATEVRRRDRQIDTLKKQLGEAGRARGSRANPAITTINVTGDFGAEKVSPSRAPNATSDDYTLRSETNAFLAKLAQDLSEENEAILGAMRRAMVRLRQMSGWDNDSKEDGQVVKQPSWQDLSNELDSVLGHMKTILTNPSFVPIEEVMVREEEINRLKHGWVKMENRWQEAVHLIESWRKRMAANGKPVCDEELQMGLRLSPVRERDMDGTRQARGFGLDAVAEEVEDMEEDMPVRQESPCPSENQSLDLVPAEGADDRGFGGPHEHSYDEMEEYEDRQENYANYEAEEPNIEVLQQSMDAPPRELSPESSPLPEPPQLSPLRNSASAGNRGAVRTGRLRKKQVDFTTITEESTKDLAGDVAPQPPPHRIKPTRQLRKPTLKAERQREKPRSASRNSLEEALLSTQDPEPQPEPEPEPAHEAENQPPAAYDSDEDELAAAPPHKTPRRETSKLPVPRHSDVGPQQSPLTMATIAAKLAASEREADAARVRAKLQAFRGAKRPTIAQPEASATEENKAEDMDADVDPVKHDLEESQQQEQEQEQQLKPEKRKRDRKTTKAASRRRSTLSPWELESLMSGNMQ